MFHYIILSCIITIKVLDSSYKIKSRRLTKVSMKGHISNFKVKKDKILTSQLFIWLTSIYQHINTLKRALCRIFLDVSKIKKSNVIILSSLTFKFEMCCPFIFFGIIQISTMRLFKEITILVVETERP